MKKRYWQMPVESTKRMREILATLGNTWTDEALLTKRMLLYACERLDEIASLLHSKRVRRKNNSPYNRFFAAGMKAGKSPTQIGKEWANRP